MPHRWHEVFRPMERTNLLAPTRNGLLPEAHQLLPPTLPHLFLLLMVVLGIVVSPGDPPTPATFDRHPSVLPRPKAVRLPRTKSRNGFIRRRICLPVRLVDHRTAPAPRV